MANSNTKSGASSLENALKELASAQRLRFSDWQEYRHEIPTEAGIYTVWHGRRFLYVGVAGTGKKHRGLRERLKQHHDGKRGMDKFSILVFDRFVLPALTKPQIRAAAAGELSLDDVTAEFVQRRLAFVFLRRNVNTALKMEKEIRQGNWKFNAPYLNAAGEEE